MQPHQANWQQHQQHRQQQPQGWSAPGPHDAQSGGWQGQPSQQQWAGQPGLTSQFAQQHPQAPGPVPRQEGGYPPHFHGSWGQAPGQMPPGTSYGQPPPPQQGSSSGEGVQLDAATMQAGAAALGMQDMAAKMAMQEITVKLNNNIARYLSPDSLRYYFQLNNAFVVNKIKVLLLPFRHRTWARATAVGGVYCEPRHDLNAPDLYLPTMAFVTYVMLIAYHLGQEGRFTPEVFGLTASKGLGVVLLEVLLMKACFYLFPSSSSSPGAALLDLAAYSGYKFVGVVVSMAAGFLLPRAVYIAVTLYLAACTGYFVLKSLTEVRGLAQLTPEVMKQNYCIIAISFLQLPFAWYLTYA